MAAMELVSRDMKAAGSYLARSLSFDGVAYLSPRPLFDAVADHCLQRTGRRLEIVLKNVNEALKTTRQNRAGAPLVWRCGSVKATTIVYLTESSRPLR